MSIWLDRLRDDGDDLSPIADCIDYFEREYGEAAKELAVDGHRLITIESRLGGITQHRYAQQQELEAILEYLNIRFNRLKGQRHRFYMEKYDRALSSRDAEKYADGDDEVMQFAMLINRVALMRNKFLSIHKGLEVLHYQLTNISKLRAAGIEDATL